MDTQISLVVFPLEGGCDCRRIRYRMTVRPLFVHCCHCRWCQRETGAAFALNAMIESDRVPLLAGEVDTVDFDSFAGIIGKKEGEAFFDGAYATSERRFRFATFLAEVPEDRVLVVNGPYADTLAVNAARTRQLAGTAGRGLGPYRLRRGGAGEACPGFYHPLFAPGFAVVV